MRDAPAFAVRAVSVRASAAILWFAMVVASAGVVAALASGQGLVCNGPGGRCSVPGSLVSAAARRGSIGCIVDAEADTVLGIRWRVRCQTRARELVVYCNKNGLSCRCDIT